MRPALTARGCDAPSRPPSPAPGVRGHLAGEFSRRRRGVAGHHLTFGDARQKSSLTRRDGALSVKSRSRCDGRGLHRAHPGARGHDARVSELEVEILPDGPALAARAADLVAERLTKVVAARGRATLAVSGGSTPAAFLAALADRALPWEAVHVFQIDERVAPPGHADRNLTGLQAALLDRVPIPPGNVHPMPVEEPDIQAAAADYGEEIRAVT